MDFNSLIPNAIFQLIFPIGFFLLVFYSYKWILKENKISDFKAFIPIYNMKVLSSLTNAPSSFYFFISGLFSFLLNFVILGFAYLKSRPDEDFTNLHSVVTIIAIILIATSAIKFFRALAGKYNYTGKDLSLFYAVVILHALCLVILFASKFFYSDAISLNSEATVFPAILTTIFCILGILTFTGFGLLLILPRNINKKYLLDQSNLSKNENLNISYDELNSDIPVDIPQKKIRVFDIVGVTVLLILIIFWSSDYFWVTWLILIPQRVKGAPNVFQLIKINYLEKQYSRLYYYVGILLAILIWTSKALYSLYLWNFTFLATILAGGLILGILYNFFRLMRKK